MRIFVPASTLRMAICGAAAAAALAGLSPATAASQLVTEVNLVTDSQAFLASQGFTAAATEDRSLINPWGVSFGPTSPFWVSNQGSGNATLYNGAGAKQALTVTIPGSMGGPTGPTGQVFNATSSFLLPGGSKGVFFFANLDGSISGWNGGQGTIAARVVNPQANAIYTGLAMGNSGGNNFLYAANAQAGRVDVFDSSYAAVTIPGGFVDPGANPAGLVPFNISSINNQLWVTYAPAQNADEAALGTGFVSVFNPDGSFVRRFATGGNLLSPWGVTRAPGTFGGLGGAILVGNFADEDGFINAFRESDGAYLGALANGDGSGFLKIPYLWSLNFGNGGAGFDPKLLYFTAGIGDEQHGLFGSLAAVPEPAQWSMLLFGFGAVGGTLRHTGRRRAEPAT